jgi:hypothetical protein
VTEGDGSGARAEGRGHAGSSPREEAANGWDARALSRRSLLAAGAAALGFARSVRAAEPQDERAERVRAVIAEYDQQGEHRTGTAVDDVSARWAVRALAGAGLTARVEPFAFQRFVQRRAVVMLGGLRNGLAAFDGGITGSGGVVGRLGPLGGAAEIGVVLIAPSPRPDALAELERLRRARHHRAIVVLPEQGAQHGDLALLNADHADAPDETPVVQLAGSNTWPLLEGARTGATARVIVEAERTPATGLNVVARRPGADATLAPLIVMTPRSGWFACASERGGGLAALFEIARALELEPPARDVHLVLTSGHELGFLGLRAWLAQHAALGERAAAWLHLGANFAAAGGDVLVQSSDAGLEALARSAFAAAGRVPARFVQPGTAPLGEAREIATHPYVSILGTNPRFHAPDDRWPDAVDLPKTLSLCAALAALAAQLAR